MSLMRKQPGLPFLLALGVLLILSASFLAVQLWSDGSPRRGAAQALEAPIMPRAIELAKRSGKSSAKKSSAAVAPAPVVKSLAPAVEDTMADTLEVDSDEPLDIDEDMTKLDEAAEKPVVVVAPKVSVPSEPAAVKHAEKAVAAVKVVAAPVVVEPIADVVQVKVKPAVVAAKSAAKPSAKLSVDPVKKAKQPRRARKAKKEVEPEDSSVVPPEWNWFNTPLKLELTEGRVEIVSSAKPAQIKLLNVVVELPEPSREPVVTEPIAVTPALVAVKVAAAEPKSFAQASLKMAELRRNREVREEKRSHERALSSGKVVMYSPSMRKIGEVIQELKIKLDRRPAVVVPAAPVMSAVEAVVVEEAGNIADKGSLADEPATIGFEEAAPLPVATDSGSAGIDSAGETTQFTPYYSGSGSSFSSKVNDMISRGQYLRN